MPSKIYNNGAAKLVNQEKHSNQIIQAAKYEFNSLSFHKVNWLDIQQAMKTIFDEHAFSFNWVRQMRSNIEEDMVKLVRYIIGKLKIYYW